MAKKMTLEDAISIADKDISKVLATDFRPILNKRVTILDLSYDALKVNVYRNTKAHLDAYNEAYKTLVQVLDEKVTRTYRSLEELPVGYFDNATAPFVYINGGDSSRFIVAKNFEAIRKFVTSYISSDPRLVKTSFGQTTLYKDELNSKGLPNGSYTKTTRTKVDIGHISSADNDNLISPLELKLSSILELGVQKANPIIIQEANKALSDLYKVQAEASYSFKNTTPEAIKLARDTLGEAYVVVTLHRQKLNNKFSTEELAIFNRLRANLALKLKKVSFENIEGSNSIIEDIVEGIVNTLSGNKKSLKSHNTHKVSKSKTVSGSAKVSSNKLDIKKDPSKSTSSLPPTLSLASLLTLLRRDIRAKLEINMGDGSRRDILNYRSGRFANTVSINRLTQSKEGMISVFYDYMKYPYATFSEGGEQDKPKSRDPKTLISRSIREIGASVVANRMRAIVV
jgi:hypothetical protein